jgi:hypothetical protein
VQARMNKGNHVGTISYFIKERESRYCPERWRVDLDHAGLVYLLEHGPVGDEFGTIRPVGFELSPRRYLVTTYQPGQPLDFLLKKAIKGGFDLAEVLRYSRLLGQWLAAFKQSGSREPETNELGIAITKTAELLATISGNNPCLLPNRSALVALPSELLLCCEGASLAARPAHGDMGAQNFILGDKGIIYPIDFSAFGFRVLDNDVALYRIRLEKAVIFGGQAARDRAGDIWQAFWDAYIESGESPYFCLLSYLHKLAGMLLLNPLKLSAGKSPRAIGRSLRDHCWRKRRFRWLAEIPGEKSSQIEYMRSVL